MYSKAFVTCPLPWPPKQPKTHLLAWDATPHRLASPPPCPGLWCQQTQHTLSYP